MNSPEMTDARDVRETTRELDDARAKYRGKIIPKPALRVMDAETARLAASRLASRALKAGDGTKAMTYAAPGIRDQFGTPENFLRMVREGYAPLLAARTLLAARRRAEHVELVAAVGRDLRVVGAVREPGRATGVDVAVAADLDQGLRLVALRVGGDGGRELQTLRVRRRQ